MSLRMKPQFNSLRDQLGCNPALRCDRASWVTTYTKLRSKMLPARFWDWGCLDWYVGFFPDRQSPMPIQITFSGYWE